VLEREKLVAGRAGQVEHDPRRIGAGPEAHVMHPDLGPRGRQRDEEGKQQAGEDIPWHFQQFGWIPGRNFNHIPGWKAISFEETTSWNRILRQFLTQVLVLPTPP